MAEISFRKLCKAFGEVKVVRDFDLDVADQEFIVLLGPSGCGKSTILRMLAGLETINSGQISIKGRIVNDLPPRERDIAMVFQNYALYPHMTVYGNIAFGLRRMGIAKDEIERRIHDAARVLGLEGFLERKSTALSGGQQQRVAIARAIVKTPGVFLFDEPLSNLDAKLRTHMRVEIAHLHRRLKTTTVYVTHDQVEAMTLADRIVLLRDGVIEQVGTPEEIYERPRSRFVAGFLGLPAMNFIEVEIARSSDRLSLTGNGFRLDVPAARYAIEGRKRAILGLRPPDVALADGELDNIISGSVDIVEYLGNEVLVTVQFAGGEIRALVRPELAPGEGATLRLRADPEKIHLFDSEEGQSLNAVVAEGRPLNAITA
jgi:multiple sugar transport system ATP-binding protein